jgi:hypothetical protein
MLMDEDVTVVLLIIMASVGDPAVFLVCAARVDLSAHSVTRRLENVNVIQT